MCVCLGGSFCDDDSKSIVGLFYEFRVLDERCAVSASKIQEIQLERTEDNAHQLQHAFTVGWYDIGNKRTGVVEPL